VAGILLLMGVTVFNKYLKSVRVEKLQVEDLVCRMVIS
jgi:hypothetical protein